MEPGPEPEVRPAQIFVDPTGARVGLVRWIGRLVALLILAYLALLGASLARAPWAPRLSLPVIGPVVAPNLKVAPPKLGAGAVSTPIPPAVISATKTTTGQGSSSGKPGGTGTPAGSTGTTQTTFSGSTTFARSKSSRRMCSRALSIFSRLSQEPYSTLGGRMKGRAEVTQRPTLRVAR